MRTSHLVLAAALAVTACGPGPGDEWSPSGVVSKSATSSSSALTCTGCPAGQLSCGGNCIDVMSDNANCGGCGVVCPSSLGQCRNGYCVTFTCGGAGNPNSDCSAYYGIPSCTSLYADDQNCGACGNVCPSGTTCLGARCGVAGTCSAPTSAEDCKKDGWMNYPSLGFKNQGDCVSYVATHGKNEPGQNAPR